MFLSAMMQCLFFSFWVRVLLFPQPPQLLGFQVCATTHSSVMLELMCDLTFQSHVLEAWYAVW